MSETCRVSCQNKFVKLVHLVSFIIKEICYDARSHERKITVAGRNFVNMPKSEYGINSHSSGMCYVYLRVNQDFVFKFITQVCTIHMAMTQQSCFYSPQVANTQNRCMQ